MGATATGVGARVERATGSESGETDEWTMALSLERVKESFSDKDGASSGMGEAAVSPDWRQLICVSK